MRKALIGIVVGCGLAATVAPALACSYNTQASAEKAPQQTASAQDVSTTKSQ